MGLFNEGDHCWVTLGADGDETFDQAVFIRPSRCIGDKLGPILQRTLGFAVTGFRDIIVFPIRAVRIVLVLVVTL